MKKILIAITLIIAIAVGGLYYINTSSNTYIGLSKEDKIFEFDYIWNELNESYPFMSYTSRSGVNLQEVYELNKKELSKSKSDIAYLKNLKFAIADLGGAGHLNIISPLSHENIYKPAYHIAANDPELNSIMKPWINVFYDDHVVKAYSMFDTTSKRFRTTKFLKKNTKKDNIGPTDNNQQLDNLTIGYIEKNKTAYLKVNSFLSVNDKKDRETLDLFYEDIANYENLIIDIRDNAGGSDLYWKQLLVSPNITKDLSFNRYALIKLNETIKPFIENRFTGNQIRPISQLPNMPRLNKDDLKEMTHFIKSSSTVVAESNTKRFKGRVWVLTSPLNYSASENFVMFCKNTGFATLVGEVTNGDGGLMDPIIIKMPKSHVLLTYSVLYGLNDDGSCNEEFGTTPDHLIKPGQDALTVCKELIKKS